MSVAQSVLVHSSSCQVVLLFLSRVPKCLANLVAMNLPVCLLVLLVYFSTSKDVRAQELADTESFRPSGTSTENQQAVELSTSLSIEITAVEAATTPQQNDETNTVLSEIETTTESTVVELVNVGPTIASIVPPEEVPPQSETVDVNVLQGEETATSTTTEAITRLNETVSTQSTNEISTTTTTEGATSASTTSIATPSKTTVTVAQTESTVATTESPRITEATTKASTKTNKPEVTTAESTSHTSAMPVTTASTTPVHECVTSMSCADPNAHCVSVGERNMCICRMGFQKNARGVCIAIATTQATSTATYVSSTIPSTSPAYILTATPSNKPSSGPKKIPVRRAQDLSQDEELDVVSIGLRPPVSVVEWLLENDLPFRSSIAKILTDAEFHTLLDEEVQHINISADQVLYISPSPQYVNDEILISIVVENSELIPIKLHSFSGTEARHKRALRDANTTTVPKYFPAIWIVRSLRLNQEQLEQTLNQTVSTLYGGEIPRKLFLFEQYASIGMLEWRLDILIPVLLAVTLLIMIILSLACVKAKKRATATWDPPAGIIFGKKVQNELKEEREDPLGSANKINSSGQNLATDEQCREGEDHPIKPARLNSEDDVWVVPYEEGPSDITRNAIRAQFEDTKL